MRIKGVEFKENVELVVIPRTAVGDDGSVTVVPIAFKCRAVNDYSEFAKLCPEINPPEVIKRGGMRELDFKDEGFIAKTKEREERRWHWMFLQSLKATPNLIWEKVNDLDPSTWHLYEEELRAAHFNDFEIGRIRKGVAAANCLDDDRINEARQSFLAGQAALSE